MTKIKNFVALLLLVMLPLSAISLTACGKKNVYIQGDNRVIELKQGQIAPVDGFLLSPAALVDLMECCDNNVK